jgi:hypothetical protein
MVNPNAVFGLHLADALNFEPSSQRKVPEACAFIGRVTALPGSADSSFEVSTALEEDSPEAVAEDDLQRFWKEGIEWALSTMSAAAARRV